MMDAFDYRDIREKSLRGPRVTSLFQHFEDIAAGIRQAPRKPVRAARRFLEESRDNQSYHEIFQLNIGTFYKHLCASIPFLVEQHCRVGIALNKLAQRRSCSETRNKPFTLYETSSADGTNARTLAQYSHGLVATLTSYH